jgi:uncharacterized membrane protein YgcG
MRKVVVALAVFLLFGGLRPEPATADVASDLSEVLARVRGLDDRVRTILSRTGGLPGVFSTLTDSRRGTEAGTPLRDLIDVAREALRDVAGREAQALKAFLAGPEPERIRGTLRDFVVDLRDLANAQLEQILSVELPCGPAPAPPTVTFDRVLDAIDAAPALAFYPIHLAQDALAQFGHLRDRLRCLVEQLTENAAAISAGLGDSDLCTFLAASPERITRLRGVATLLNVLAWLTKKTGDAVQEISQTLDLQLEGEAWGFIGIDIKVEVVQPLGHEVEGTSTRLARLATWLTGRLDHCEILAGQDLILENQRLLLEGQQAILEALGQNGGGGGGNGGGGNGGGGNGGGGGGNGGGPGHGRGNPRCR